jgi:UDP-N-acetylmuramate--alanine ligase
MDKSVKSQPIFGRTRHIHMVGIGGIGMSGMAEILLLKDFTVTGSDTSMNDSIARLEKLGAQVHIGHDTKNIEGADVVVYTSAVKAEENIETRTALEKGIPVIKRAEMLAELMRIKYGVGIAGTHGKTTTTTLTGHVIQDGGLDPTIIVGGKVHSFSETNAVVGEGDIFVVEADEFDRTFLRLTPSLAIITNIEADHLDIYGNLENVKQAFIDFANKVPFYGAVIICLDDRMVRGIIPEIGRRIITYGLTPQAQIRAVDIQTDHFNSTFTVLNEDEKLGRVTLKTPGNHNVKNALAAVAAGLELNISWKRIKEGLEHFEGIFRRFQLKTDRDDIMVIDDYAHHPTEIQATIGAARMGWKNRRIIAVFQPHLYSRTKALYNEFGLSFFDAELCVITDVYPARENPIEGVSGKLIADAAKEYGHRHVHYVKDKKALPAKLQELAAEGDLFITMGAGDIYQYGQEFVDLLNDEKLD